MTPNPAIHAREWAQSAIDRSSASGQPVLLSLSLPIPPLAEPLAFLESASRKETHSFFWQRSLDDFSIVALGSVAVCEAEGESRFDRVGEACDKILENAIIKTVGDPSAAGPVFVGGFSFADKVHLKGKWDGFPAGRLVLPRLHVVQRERSTMLTVNTIVGGQSNATEVATRFEAELSPIPAVTEKRSNRHGGPLPARQETVEAPPSPVWLQSVAATIADIQAGRLEKLVLARESTVRSEGPLDGCRVLRRLQQAYPDCTAFFVGTPHGSFLGATPERLVALHDRQLQTAAIAGSIARGSSPDEDGALAQALKESPKERHEHAVVVHAIESTLEPICESLDVASEPDLLRLKNVQHLVTPITGRLMTAQSVLDLAGRLHPSPAVGGYPRDVAMNLLRERENIERGWYAGPVGWMDSQRDGEFAVAVRCTLVRGSEATFWAGAGIVAGSDPEAELAETRLKLSPVLSALRES